MGKKRKDTGAEDFAAEVQEDQDTLPTDGSNILDDGGIAPGTEDAPAAVESDTEERDDAALDNAGVAPAGDAPGSDIVSDSTPEDTALLDQAHDSSGELATEDANGANPSTTDGGELAEAAKPPESEPSNDPLGTAVQGTALAADPSEPAHAGSEVIPTPTAAPAEVAAEGADDAEQGGDTSVPGADAAGAEAGAGEMGNDAAVGEDTLGEDSASVSTPGDDEGKSEPSSTDSSASPLEPLSEDKPATEAQMPKLAEVHTEAAPIAEAAGDDTMGKFKDAGNLMTEGLASLREVEEKLERLGDEAKARLAHLRHKATEALAALEAWFSRS